MKRKKWPKVILVILIVWLVMAAVDFSVVHGFRQPVFCVQTMGADDGGSGRYVGLGYFFDIEGNFMPDAENPGVTSYEGRLFGIPLIAGIKD